MFEQEEFPEKSLSMSSSTSLTDQTASELGFQSDQHYISAHNFSSLLGSSVEKVGGGSISRDESNDQSPIISLQNEENIAPDQIKAQESKMEEESQDSLDDFSTGDVLQ